MKNTKMLMLFPFSLLTMLLSAAPQQTLLIVADNDSPMLAETPTEPHTVAYDFENSLAVIEESPSAIAEDKGGENNKNRLITYAMSLLGTPYVWAGVSPKGFDCSGFITHVFQKFDVAVPHSSALQAKEGEHIARDEAKIGDLVIFTGTNPKKRTPGHVGIIISTDDDNIEFVHSSSVGGVKVSKVEGTGYSRRFMEIRRIL
ncbi:C40 family peptidase [Pontibacter pamirensis]|uniref:C40 family peptidase n=1 Tax=Pontibacter pamirensis TaxID=2562824 RepID=UPI0013897231|nr:C40 family peptidase [Pontibacter pamirensis]